MQVPFFELSWDDKEKKYKEIDNDWQFFGDALFTSGRKHFIRHNWIEFCLLYVPQTELETKLVNGRLELLGGPVGNAVDGLRAFCKKDNCHYSFLSEDTWKPGYTDYSAQTSLVAVLNLIITHCAASPVCLKQSGELTQALSTKGLTCTETINLKFHEKPGGSPCYMHLFIISEACYNEIRFLPEKLPDNIACVFRFERNKGSVKEHTVYPFVIN